MPTRSSAGRPYTPAAAGETYRRTPLGAAIMMTSLEPCTRERKWFSAWASSWVRVMLSRSMMPWRTTSASATVPR